MQFHKIFLLFLSVLDNSKTFVQRSEHSLLSGLGKNQFHNRYKTEIHPWERNFCLLIEQLTKLTKPIIHPLALVTPVVCRGIREKSLKNQRRQQKH